MNIMEYRAMKQAEQEQQQVDSQGTQSREEQPNVQAQPTTTQPDEQTNQAEKQRVTPPVQEGAEGQTQTKPSETQTTEPQVPQVVEVDGREIPVEELKKGYMLQSDYTRKTQELADAKRELEYAEQFYREFTKDPELAEQLAKQFDLPYVDPNQRAVMELQNRYNDLLLEREVETLQSKYQDFDVHGVLQFAYDRRLDNLEDAYHLYKSYNGQTQAPVDSNTIKEQLRQEILRELQSNVDTTSIIQSGGDTQPVRDNTPTLSSQELKIARNMRMSPEEYAKWRDKR